jgi:hypothetical protein
MTHHTRLLAVFVAALLTLGATALQAQLVGVTFLNNSPDPALQTADIYIAQGGGTQKGEDIRYQSADNLPSVFIFGDLETTITVAPGSSSSEADKVAQLTFTPAIDATYMIVISGVGSTDGYAPNPDGAEIGYTLTVFETPFFGGDPTKIGAMFVAGATDQNRFDVLGAPNVPIVRGLAYPNYTDTITSVDRSITRFIVTAPGKPADVFGAFDVNLQGYSSDVVVFVLSGFKTPQDNTAGEPLVLLAVLEDGNVIRNELVQGSQTASVQLIHNAADPAAKIVDVWLNGQKAVDNFTFRTGTGFVDVPAGEPLTIGIAPATSSTYADTLFTVTLPSFRTGKTYQVFAHGVATPASFAANPQERDIAFKLTVAENALIESTTDGKTSIRVAHGVTDAGALVVQSAAGVTYATGELYGDVSLSYLAVDPVADTLWVYDSVGGTPLVGFVANLSGNKRAAVLMASGFLTPADNNNGDPLALVLIDANGRGTVLPSVLPPVVSVEEDATRQWTLAPNPASDVVTVCGLGSLGSVGSQIIIADMHGNTHSTAIQNGEAFSTANLATGLYLVRVVDANGLGSDVRMLRIVR